MLPGELAENIEAEIKEAEEKAWQSLAHYKFQMFGYWAVASGRTPGVHW
jgi:hypothetical protein